MSTALITGATGQDARYLSEYLFNKGYRVVGCTRDPGRARDHLRDSMTEFLGWDAYDSAAFSKLLERVQPTEIYNLAAYTSGAAMFDDPLDVAEVNGLCVARILEAVRYVNPKIRFCQASSREIFGEPIESPQTELTPRCPRSPYGAAKLYADNMVRIYRERYGLHACSAILFNHESPRRSLNFVTRKIAHEAVRIKLGEVQHLHLGNIDSQRDWGFAGDYVRAMWLMLQQPRADDYVIATGEAHSVREFCELAFARLGLDYREHVREDPTAFRPLEAAVLVGSSDKARHVLGWEPKVSFVELIHMMVDADMQTLGQSTQGTVQT